MECTLRDRESKGNISGGTALVRLNIRKLADGETLSVTADDPSTARDIPSFCRFMDHTLVASQTETLPYQYVIKKGRE